MNEKGWLDKIYYEIGKQEYNFQLGSAKMKKSGEVIFWRNVQKEIGIVKKGTKITYMLLAQHFDHPYFQNFLSKLNQRQILPNEVVLDFEDKDSLPFVVKELQSLKVQFYVFSTGSRGFHIHIFFNKEISEEDKLKIIQHFGADPQLASSKHMVALEFAPHWKSGKIKSLIEIKEVLKNGN